MSGLPNHQGRRPRQTTDTPQAFRSPPQPPPSTSSAISTDSPSSSSSSSAAVSFQQLNPHQQQHFHLHHQHPPLHHHHHLPQQSQLQLQPQPQQPLQSLIFRQNPPASALSLPPPPTQPYSSVSYYNLGHIYPPSTTTTPTTTSTTTATTASSPREVVFENSPTDQQLFLPHQQPHQNQQHQLQHDQVYNSNADQITYHRALSTSAIPAVSSPLTDMPPNILEVVSPVQNITDSLSTWLPNSPPQHVTTSPENSLESTVGQHSQQPSSSNFSLQYETTSTPAWIQSAAPMAYDGQPSFFENPSSLGQVQPSPHQLQRRQSDSVLPTVYSLLPQQQQQQTLSSSALAPSSYTQVAYTHYPYQPPALSEHPSPPSPPLLLQPTQPPPPSSSSSSLQSQTHQSQNQLEKKYQCTICGKFFRRDLPRHLRTHQEVGRFTCPFPRDQCAHKRGQFNRPYDFKKHLLHGHFTFDDQKRVRSFRDLKSKLEYQGTCVCGKRFRAVDWLDEHIMGGQDRCPLLVGSGSRDDTGKHHNYNHNYTHNHGSGGSGIEQGNISGEEDEGDGGDDYV